MVSGSQVQKKIVKFLVIGDLHGRKPKIHSFDFDAIIAPGDICGDDLRPYMKKWIAANKKDGTYTKFSDFCSLEKEKELNLRSIKKGRKILEYLNSFGKPVFVVPGNWDHTPYLDGCGSLALISKKDKNPWEKIKRGLSNIYDIEFRRVNFMGLCLIGHGSVSAPEVLKKVSRDMVNSDEEYERYLLRYRFFSKVYPKMRRLFMLSKNPVIHLSHNVPYDTKLDKVAAPGTYADNEHYGSIMARKLIEEFNPVVCIGGHIHEGFGKDKIGKTLCINAGFGGDVNTIVSVDSSLGKVVLVEFVGENLENG